MITRRTIKSSKKGRSGHLLWRPLSLFSIFIFAVITAVPSLMAATGDFSIDFVAASPDSYNHLTGGGAYDDRTVGVSNDIVESLEGGDFACGDIVTYFAAVTVDNTQSAIDDGPQTIEMDFSFLMDTTGQSGVAIGDIVNVGVNYGTIEDLIAGENSVDDGIVDDGGSVATLIDEYTTGPIFTAGSELWGTVELTDLEANEQVVVRIDVKLFCDPGSNPTGNLQADLQDARLTFINNTTPVDPPPAIPGGAQTIPFKQFGNIQTPDLAIAKTVTTADGTCPGLETLTVTAGDTVKYCYVVSNPGTAPLYNVALTDDNGTPGDPGDDFLVPLVGLTDMDNDGSADDLAAGAFATGEALVTLATAGTVVNTGTATGVDSILFPTEYTASDIATVIVEPPPVEAPQTRVIKGAVDGNDNIATLDEPGDAVTIDVVVYNDAPTPTGDATLTSLVDNIYGDITTTGHDDITATTCVTGGVIPGGGSYSCSFTVDITSEPGTITDTVTATLTNDAAAVSDDDQANVVITDVAPTVTLVKSANPTTLLEPGGDFVFTLDITNTSGETVTITALTDTQSGVTDFSNCSALIGTTLAAGESTSCQYTVSHTDVGSYDNTASVTVTDNDGSTASASDSATVTLTDVLPTVDLTKEATPLSLDEPGGDFLFTLTIVNTSVEEVTITALSDSQSAEAVDFSACSSLVGTTLAAGASTSCQYTVNHTTPGSYDNTASVTVADNEGNTASGTDSATVVVNDVPSAISMVKTAVPATVTEPGSDVTYTFTVFNDSAVDSVTIDSLTDTVYGDLDGQGTCSVPQTIPAGGSYTCTFTFFVSSSETNVATASGVDDDGNPVSASDDASVTVNDSYTNIVVTKTAVPTSVNEPGGDVTFSVTIDNPSTVDSVTINSLVDDIHGDLNGQGDCAVPQTIAIGGSYTCSFTATVSGNAGDSETDVVTASGVDEDGVPVSDDDSAIVTVADVQPTISVDKTADPTSVDEPGGEVTFTVVVTNNSVGSDPVTITSLTDSIHGDLNGQGDCTVPQTIAAGGSYTCSFTATVSGNAGDSETDVVTASGNDDEGNPVSASDDATVTVNDVPSSILTTKSASPTSVPETGGDVTFTITVQNTSAVDDVTINSVVDDVFGDVSASCAPALPALLVPGESLTCTFTEFISGDYPDIHTNVATATGEDDDGNPVEDDDQEDVPFEDVLPDITVIKSANPSSVPETGGNVTFTFVATNNSLEAVTLDSMIDDTFGDLNGQGTCALPQALGPAGDESASYTCTITVFLAADDLAPHINVVTASASDDEGNTATDTDNETVTFTDVAPQIELIKSASPTSVPETGGDVTFTFTVNNIGQEDVTLTSLTDTVFNDLSGQGTCAVPQTILIGQSYSCEYTVFLSADDLVDHYNVATATAVDDDGTEDSDDDNETVTFTDVAPQIQITKSASPSSVPETGGDVTFTFLVENIGQEDVTLTSLTDTVFGDLNGQGDCATGGLILMGDSYSCSITVNLSADDLAPHTNVATAVGTDDDGTTDEDTDDETVTFEDVAPVIQITKTASPSSVPETGGNVTFTFLVENIGQEDVTLTSLTDTVFGDLNGQGTCAIPQAILIGGSYECSITVFLAADDLAPHTNVATATAVDDDGTQAEDSDDETVTFEDVLPDVSITKTAVPTSVPETGGNVEFTIVITNNSLEDATIDSLVDSDFNLAAHCPDAVGTVLAYGESYTCVFTEFISGDFSGLAHENTATVEASDNDGNTDTASDDETVTFTDVLPDVSITKTANPISVYEPGDNVEFTIVVTNNSLEDATIDSLVDSDFDLTANCPGAVGTVLASGASYTCVFTEFVAGNVGEDHQNTATVVASDNDGNSDTESDSADVTIENVAPAITIVKDGEVVIAEGGDTATYSFTITNNSVSTDPLTITSLTDDKFGDLLPEAEAANGGPITLNPGESFSFSIDRDLTLDAGESHTNWVTVVATDDEGDTATDSDDHTVTGENVAPVIDIVKDGPASINEGGDTATYSFTITNNSVSTDPLTITSLNDDQFGDLLAEAEALYGGGPIILNQGDSFTFTIDRDLTLNVGETHTNVVTVVGVDDEGTEATDNDNHTVGATDVAPMISIVKDGPASINEGGDSATYDITITNNSVSTDPLTITSLLDNQFGDLLPEAEAANGGTITLNPGESLTFQITRALTLNVGETHTNVVTVVGVDDEGTEATDNDNHTVGATDVAPMISIVKDGPATINEGGDSAIYDITITNDSVSTDPLTITSLLDDKFGDLLPEAEAARGGPIVLAPGESFSFQITRSLEFNVGDLHTNVVTVIGVDDEGTEATDNDDHTVAFDNVDPAITVTKTADQAQVFAPGEDVTFTVVIENNSVSTDPVTINSLVDSIHGDLNGQGDCSVPQTIQPGNSYTCSFTVLVDGDETDVITASGTDDDGTPVSDSDDATVDMIHPAISIVKLTNGYDANNAPGPEILVGNTVTWEYIVSNDGDVTLENISVVDDQGVAVSCPTDTLLVNQSMSCFATGISEVGQYANLGTVTATHTDVDGDTANRTDDDPSHYFGAAPSIAIDKQTADAYGNEGDAIGILPGETVTWNYYVTNDGNVDLVYVSVTDDQGVSVTCPQNTLAVGESMTCTASGSAGENWYYNVGTASGDYTDDVGNSTTVTDSDGSSYYGLTPGAVTNSSLCDFGDQFRLLFTPDMGRYSSSTPYYKLSDSNPGQFFYNVFYVNDGSTDTITLEIPYPFVTQGANPVHVYGGLFVNPEGSGGINCFMPTNELAAYGSVFGLGDYTDTNGDGVIGFGDVYLVDVPAELGFQYINIHLDYGLEKTDGWLKKGANATSDGTGKNPAPAGISINDNTAHTFQAYADGVLIDGSTDTVYNLNEYKQIRGFGGLVQYTGSLDPVVGAEVQLFDQDGNLIETMTTDSDGWYLSEYQHKGKAATYTLVLVSTGEAVQTTVGGKDKFGEGNFLVP